MRRLEVQVVLPSTPAVPALTVLSIEAISENGDASVIARHTLTRAYDGVGRRRYGDNLAGLVSVAERDDELVAVLEVPLSRLRVSVARNRDSVERETIFYNETSVGPAGANEAPSRAVITMPAADAATLEIRGRWVIRCLGSMHVRRDDGLQFELLRSDWPRRSSLLIAFLPPGTYRRRGPGNCESELVLRPHRRTTIDDVGRGCGSYCPPTCWTGRM